MTSKIPPRAEVLNLTLKADNKAEEMSHDKRAEKLIGLRSISFPIIVDKCQQFDC